MRTIPPILLLLLQVPVKRAFVLNALALLEILQVRIVFLPKALPVLLGYVDAWIRHLAQVIVDASGPLVHLLAPLFVVAQDASSRHVCIGSRRQRVL